MQQDSSTILFALAVTAFAGLSTGIGSAIAYFAKRTNFRFLSFALGFSGGVMLYVSFTEILAKADASLAELYGQPAAGWITTGAFFLGIVVMMIIDRLVPDAENPHELTPRSQIATYQSQGASAVPGSDPARDQRLMRMGLFSALAIAIHNFPEGLATFLAAMENPQLGIAIGLAIAIHNIPEGIAVSVPIFYATGSRRKAFLHSFLSGLSEPIGGIVGFFLLSSFATPEALGITFGAVAGIMVYISLDELLPTAREYATGHEVLYGIMGGMAVMAVSLLLVR
ncbi:MAG: zinc transporter ZupT [Ignavibacteriae bacterium]|nr:zinc transporter ZupT [Ignavibacteriota bacterium]